MARGGQQIEGRGFEDRPIQANLPQAVEQVRFDLSGLKSPQSEVSRDPGVERAIVAQPQGLLQIQISDSDQGQDRLPGQVRTQEQPDLLQRAGRIVLSFVQNQNRSLLQVFDDGLLSAIHPPGKANQQKRQRIHRKTIPLPAENDQLCFGTDDLGTSRNMHNIN